MRCGYITTTPYFFRNGICFGGNIRYCYDILLDIDDFQSCTALEQCGGQSAHLYFLEQKKLRSPLCFIELQ